MRRSFDEKRDHWHRRAAELARDAGAGQLERRPAEAIPRHPAEPSPQAVCRLAARMHRGDHAGAWFHSRDVGPPGAGRTSDSDAGDRECCWAADQGDLADDHGHRAAGARRHVAAAAASRGHDAAARGLQRTRHRGAPGSICAGAVASSLRGHRHQEGPPRRPPRRAGFPVVTHPRGSRGFLLN
jgi:hypothetical protein